MAAAHAQYNETGTLSSAQVAVGGGHYRHSLPCDKVLTAVVGTHAAMDDNSQPANASPSNHRHENGITNGYSSEKHHHHRSSSKSEHKDKHRDKEREHKSKNKEHKSSSRDKDKDRERHHSSKDKSSSHKSSNRDKDKEKDRHRDKDKHSSSSSKDKEREHKSSKEHKSSRDKDRGDREKDKSSREHKEKDRSKDKEKDRHRHSSNKDKNRDKERDRDRKDRKDKDRRSEKHSASESPEKIKVEIKEEPQSQHNGDSDYADNDDKKLIIKEEFDSEQYDKANNSQASSCDYNLSQFKDESKFTADEEEEAEEPEEDSEEDIPLAKRLSATSKRKYVESDDEEVEKKKLKKAKTKKRNYSDNEDDEDIKPAKKKGKKKAAEAAKTTVKQEPDSPTKKRKKKKEEEQQEVWKWWEEEKRDDGTKWRFLEHKGPVFPPDYERIPSKIKFIYDGKEMTLSDDAEEIAGFYAKMLDHDYTTKDMFNNNFFKDWRKSMTDEERKKITDLKKCNFKKMHAYFMDLAEKNRNRTKEEKLVVKEKNEEMVKEYGFCTIDGHKEKIGNFKIEPPGLFRGRGEHPKMGMLKRRVMPEDVLINCSKDSHIPKPPAGHKWKEVRHDPSVTWLASWTENVQNQVKYVMLNPSSKLKGEKDWQKYETARRLHKCIDKIRSEYRDGWKSKEMRIRQRAVALYFIDRLALRAGNEKDEDQADTVGCCSLRVEHIQLHETRDDKDYVVVFDFLGKDSIRYYNEVPVEKRVFKNLQLFMDNKSPGDDLFDRLNTAVMNKHLNELMEGLSAKVFRTYNASFTLQQQLDKLTNPDDSLAEKILAYNRANRAVAILCNHQRAVPKSHAKSMEKLKEKIDGKRDQVKDAERAVKDAARDAKHGSVKEKQIYETKKKQLQKMREQLSKLEIQETDRDENKTIALGTSKLNYLDPRISVAWCKKYDVPIEKIYNKTQRDKFRWAIDMAGPDYVF